MTKRNVPIREMSMIATGSAIRDLAAADVTTPARMRSTMTAITRSSPKTWSVADAANVPRTARMIRNRLVPRMSRITVDRSCGSARAARQDVRPAERDGLGSDGDRSVAVELGANLRRREVPEDQGRHDRHPESDPGTRELEEREDRLEQGEPRDEHREEASPRLERPEPECRGEPDDAGGDGEPAPDADVLEGGQITERPEPVEADHSEAHEQEAEAGKGGKEADDRDEDGWITHWTPSVDERPLNGWIAK